MTFLLSYVLTKKILFFLFQINFYYNFNLLIDRKPSHENVMMKWNLFASGGF